MPKSNSFLFLGKVGRVEWSWSLCHSQPLPDPPGCGKRIWCQNTKYWWQDPPASATWNIWTSHKFFPVDKWGMNNFYGLGVIPGIRTCYVGFLNYFILWACPPPIPDPLSSSGSLLQARSSWDTHVGSSLEWTCHSPKAFSSSVTLSLKPYFMTEVWLIILFPLWKEQLIKEFTPREVLPQGHFHPGRLTASDAGEQPSIEHPHPHTYFLDEKTEKQKTIIFQIPSLLEKVHPTWTQYSGTWASQVTLMVKNPPAHAGDTRDVGLIPGLGRSSEGRHGSLLQYSCLENPMGRGAWWNTVHRVVQSQTWLKQLSTHAFIVEHNN